VPSWSKVAMRSSGGTNCGLEVSVVALTKFTIACLADPSFQEDNVLADCGVVVQPAQMTKIKTEIEMLLRQFFMSVCMWSKV
jgi:hypothetical protein